MKATKHVSVLTDPKSKRSCFCGFFPAAFLLCVVFFLGTAFVATDFKGILLSSGLHSRRIFGRGYEHDGLYYFGEPLPPPDPPSLALHNLSRWGMATSVQKSESNKCENQCRSSGSEALPRGIVSTTSNLEMRPLWGFPKKDENSSISLLAVAAGIKQKDLVNIMVEKFLSNGFVVMLFHYDGIVDEWTDFGWSDRVVHVAAVNQTKWWFAKRFLHPDIVADYSYIFVWDEDLGVEHFNPERYLEIVKVEGLEISQPALDYSSAELHHQITARGRRTTVHRRTYKPGGAGKGCDDKSTAPPCTGWIELMAPVFSRAAWRCVWYMIQNDLIHAWGLDMQLGYCAQGDRTIKIGVVDSEYVFHHGLPTLGAISENKMNSPADGHTKNENTNNTQASKLSHIYRVSVRRQSFIEWRNFKRRWKQAVREDKCWVDPYN